MTLERLAEKQFRKLPDAICKALRTWTLLVEEDRQGQRSSRLNIAYRLIYREMENGELAIVSVIEVNKHDY